VPGIAIAFATVNQWPGGGFQGEFRARNDEGVPLDHWGATFTFTGSFQSVWDGQISRIGETQTFSLSAPAHNLVLDPGETAVVGVTGTFASPAAPPANFAVSAGTFAVRPLANPQPPCLGVSCPSGTHCEVPASGIPTCVSDS
jgi:hypothetical protein